ncbi:MAG TPA: undecaprenyl-phosphate glucose phosphotransferase [Aggregatilinea sp.]|uniref:undecaprenyl-phosphate glucose phosphotransferase n=1 Tax=Aggregatilinea sp. TaxID=2806333 RepID=UPI002BEE81FD|nr:undecaprenyl-phosphate glucose phosphotransferase [Aggregatilinea sp.]HML24343.1 undecaprenyl-phosphate glucose phosphotransferase [Aggregatilinea sp.]
MARFDAALTDRGKLDSRNGHRLRGVLHTSLLLIDGLMLALAFLLGYIARARLPLPALPVNPPSFTSYVPMMIVHVTSVLIVFYFARMYHMRRMVSRFDESYAIAQNVSIGTFLAVAIETLAFKNSGFELDYPRGVIIYAWVFGIVLTITGRGLYRQTLLHLRQKGVGRDNVLIIGSGDVARTISEKIRWSPQLGYSIVGAVNGAPGGKVGEVPIIGTTGQLPELIDEYAVDEVIIALPEASHSELVHLINKCQRGKVNIKIYPDIFAYMAGGLTVDDLNGLPLLSVRDVALRGWKLSLKRGMDIIGAFVGLVFLSPMFVLTAIAVKLESPGPSFFCQERMGLDGRPFPLIKFRTMRADSERNGPGWTVQGDPRVTRIGRMMRKTNWDEMPNLINVLFGQMSLVGPRPEQPYYVERFREYIPRYMERHREKAGMTGWAQVNGLRGDTSILERTKYDLWYVENWSLWLDIKIVLRTVLQTITRRSRNAM